jgi:AcrR family transcriptional regulator
MDTRTRIIYATLQLLFQNGVESVTMKSVAAKAKIGKSTVYEYFESKEAMISQSIILAAHDFVERFHEDTLKNQQLSFEEALKNSINKLLQAFETELGAFIKLMNEKELFMDRNVMDSCKDELFKLQEKSLGYTKTLIDLGIKDGLLNPGWAPMDTVIFQRMLIILVASFYDETPIIIKHASEIPNKSQYIYHKMLQTFKV